MSTTLELKHRVRELEARLKAVELAVQGMVLANLAPKLVEVTKQIEAAQPKLKLCPHCGEKPGYFFHVRSCLKKNKNNDDRNRDPGGA